MSFQSVALNTDGSSLYRTLTCHMDLKNNSCAQKRVRRGPKDLLEYDDLLVGTAEIFPNLKDEFNNLKLMQACNI